MYRCFQLHTWNSKKSFTFTLFQEWHFKNSRFSRMHKIIPKFVMTKLSEVASRFEKIFSSLPQIQSAGTIIRHIARVIDIFRVYPFLDFYIFFYRNSLAIYNSWPCTLQILKSMIAAIKFILHLIKLKCCRISETAHFVSYIMVYSYLALLLRIMISIMFASRPS